MTRYLALYTGPGGPRFIDFVRAEEEQIQREPSSNKRAYMDLPSKEQPCPRPS